MASGKPNGDERVCLGLIAGAHGLAGEVRLKSYTGKPQDIAAYGPLEDTAGRRFEITKLRPGKNVLIGRLKGVGTREDAEALKGTELFVSRARLPETGDDEWYYADLIGLRAVDTSDAVLGEVVAVQNYGAGDLLEIKPEAGKGSILMPFRAETVREVDLAANRIVIDPPEGLLDD